MTASELLVAQAGEGTAHQAMLLLGGPLIDTGHGRLRWHAVTDLAIRILGAYRFRVSMPKIASYPLQWPPGLPRTEGREVARFRVTLTRATDDLFEEIRRLSVPEGDAVLSTNLQLRLDGRPRGRQGEPTDPGVALYFSRGGQTHVIACDKWTMVADNIRALGRTIQAMRALERYGATDVLERAFAGFRALPEPSSDRPWWDVFGLVRPPETYEIAKRAYRDKMRERHPDGAGAMADEDRARELNLAHEKARVYYGIG